MKDRRTFLKAAAALGAAPYLFSTPREKTPRNRSIVKPNRLVRGSTLGLVAPASNAQENEDIRFAMDILDSMGFRVKPGANLFSRRAYLAGHDRDRADDLNHMFADDSVDGIIALRGGYGTLRLLPFLDYKLIRQNPKVLVGYSDLTALLHAIHVKTGLVTFHGPIAKQTFSAYTLAEFKKVLMEPQAPVTLASPPPFEEKEGAAEQANRLTVFTPGKARGGLVGGNLSLLSRLLGTPYEPDFKGRILIMEDVGEEPYRIDRMLTHLWLAGKLEEVAGIVFGKFVDCDSEGGNSLSLEEIFSERVTPLGVPAIRGLMIGHVRDQTTFPLGVPAELDVNAGTLTLLEPAVI